MRSLITLGVVSLVGVAGMFACGDDDGGDGTNSTAGTGGRGGTGGASGGTGGATGGTAGSTAGRGGTGGSGTTPPPGPLATCTGCVELIAPLTGPNDNDVTTTLADQIGYQFAYATPADFSNAIVTWTVAAVAPNVNTFVQLYAQNGAPNYEGAYLSFNLDPAQFPANQFREIVLDLAAVAAAPGDAGAPDAGEPPVVVVPDAGADAGDDAGAAPATAPTIIGVFDKSRISQLGITIGVGNAFTGSTVLRVAIDEVSIAGVAGETPHTFTAGAEGLALNNFQNLTGMQAPVHHP